MADSPDSPAISDGATTLSYVELHRAVSRVAGGLSAKGIGKGDRVAIIADNRIEFLMVALACAKLAAIFVPMGLRLRAPEISYICETSGARILIHDADLAAQVRDTAIALYSAAVEYAATRGIIIADTKFEFGLDQDGTLTLMDEVLTPDSSRFWPADSYEETKSSQMAAYLQSKPRNFRILSLINKKRGGEGDDA